MSAAWTRCRDGARDHAAPAGGLRPFARPRELRARHLWRAGRRRLGLAHRGSPPHCTSASRATATSTLPQFFGANPAVVPRDVGGGAPREGWLLGSEEDLARQWLASLTSPQRARAIFDTRPFGDIVSRNATRARPLDAGLPFAQMDAAQQAQVLKLIGAFADHLQPELTQAPRACARGSTRFDPSRLGWIGSAASAALLSHPGRELPHRVRQLGRQPHPLRCGATSKATSAATCCVTTTAARRAPRIGMAAERMLLHASRGMHTAPRQSSSSHWPLRELLRHVR